ncbi:MAG: PepSY domain-containing protein [Aquabacterium sp.]|jgi:uncharacterized iron-regulated membrane protein|nr:MAG: PepSY domain-containing protein [Aquabacterium sp.]
MTNSALRRWAWIHKWSSLVSTIFMLLLCLTGLPLIFHHEIGHLLGTEVEAPEMPAGTPTASLDEVAAAARAVHPGRYLHSLFRDADERNVWFAFVGDQPESTEGDSVAIDARTAKVLAQPKFDEGFMYVMFKLHVDLFAELPGKLFLGLMGILLVVAIVSGVVLYAPFMRKLDFGTVRRDRSTRLKWLDLHNLLGIVTLSWALVVGATGVLNTWADLVIKYWQFDQLGRIVAPYKGHPVPTRLASVETAARIATALEPTLDLAFIAFPGTTFSSPHHYAVFLRGTEPLTARLLKPVLVDAQDLKVSYHGDLPWYVTALLVSQPLHFGDYGGMPLKILWAALDVITIVVLGSGLYLWWQRRRKPIEELLTAAVPAAPEATA